MFAAFRIGTLVVLALLFDFGAARNSILFTGLLSYCEDAVLAAAIHTFSSRDLSEEDIRLELEELQRFRLTRFLVDFATEDDRLIIAVEAYVGLQGREVPLMIFDPSGSTVWSGTLPVEPAESSDLYRRIAIIEFSDSARDTLFAQQGIYTIVAGDPSTPQNNPDNLAICRATTSTWLIVVR